MTDIGVNTQAFQPENLSWDQGGPGQLGAGRRNGTLDISKFVQAQHFANGFIPSGTVLGIVTASGLLAPYLGTANDGSQTAVGILAATIQVVQGTGALKSRVGCAYHVAYRTILQSKLPFTSGNAAAGGFLDAAAKTALKLLDFAA